MSDEGVRVTVQYKLGHSYNFEYVPSGGHCPHCGSEDVWVENGGGDYYVGPTFVCTDCRCDFTLQGPSEASPESMQVIDQILAAHPMRRKP